MSQIVYRICVLLGYVLISVPLGTNLGLFYLLFAILSGRLLASRGALFPALQDLGLPKDAVRRSVAALAYGRFQIADLLRNWQARVLAEGQFQAHCYEGFRPVACDLIGFFRPRLRGCLHKHYHSGADKALPAIVLAVVGAVGSVGKQRLALPRHLLHQEQNETETDLAKRAIRQMADSLAEDETALVDAGFSVALIQEGGVGRFVARGRTNATFRRNVLPEYKGHGRHCEYGDLVRVLPGERADKPIVATPPDATARFKDGRYKVRVHLWYNLVLPDQKPGAPTIRCIVFFHPRYKHPLVLVTNLCVTAFALLCLYRDRWPIEQLPLSAKQMLGAERSFVSSQESRTRLPELALLAGNILSYVAATSAPVATGFWDRACRATCGRLRRALSGVHFWELSLVEGQLREKQSATWQLPKGVEGCRRQKASKMPLERRKAA